MATGWDEIAAALLAGSPLPTSAGNKIRIDSANDADAYPFVIGHSVSTERDFGMDNTLLSVKETFHVECWAETRAEANVLEGEVVAALLVAGLVPDPSGPDGMDPTVDVRCVDVFVPTWITPSIP